MLIAKGTRYQKHDGNYEVLIWCSDGTVNVCEMNFILTIRGYNYGRNDLNVAVIIFSIPKSVNMVFQMDHRLVLYIRMVWCDSAQTQRKWYVALFIETWLQNVGGFSEFKCKTDWFQTHVLQKMIVGAESCIRGTK